MCKHLQQGGLFFSKGAQGDASCLHFLEEDTIPIIGLGAAL